MLQNILNLSGAQELSRNEQQTILGGGCHGYKNDCLPACNTDADCPQCNTCNGSYCHPGDCD